MKSITIHNIDNVLEEVVKRQAAQNGTSLNRTIKNLLRQSLGISEERKRKHADFSAFSGIWSTRESKKFAKNIKDFEKVNAKDWK